MAAQTQLGRFIHECRASLKYTSRRVAALASERGELGRISESYLLAVEKGRHVPALDKLLTLAEVLEVPVEQFIDRCREDLGLPVRAPADLPFEDAMELGQAKKTTGDYREALHFFRQAYALADTAAPDPATAVARSIAARLEAATCHRQLGNDRAASEELRTVLREPKLEPGLRRRAALNLAEVQRKLGDAVPALALARLALDLAREAKDVSVEAKALGCLGRLATDTGDHSGAQRHYREARALHEQAGDRTGVAVMSLSLAFSDIEAGEPQRARDALSQLVDELGALGQKKYLADAHFGLAKAFYASSGFEAAKKHARKAKQIAEESGFTDLVFLSLYYMWRVALRQRQEKLVTLYADRLGFLGGKLGKSYPELEEFQTAQAARRVR